jgi:hypothetical protein
VFGRRKTFSLTPPSSSVDKTSVIVAYLLRLPSSQSWVETSPGCICPKKVLPGTWRPSVASCEWEKTLASGGKNGQQELRPQEVRTLARECFRNRHVHGCFLRPRVQAQSHCTLTAGLELALDLGQAWSAVTKVSPEARRLDRGASRPGDARELSSQVIFEENATVLSW